MPPKAPETDPAATEPAGADASLKGAPATDSPTPDAPQARAPVPVAPQGAEPLVARPTLDAWDLARKQAELDRLNEAIAAREADLDAYDRLLAAFRVRYGTRLAGPYAELEALEAQIAARKAALKPGDASQARKAERLQAELEGWGPAASAEPPGRVAPADDLKALYRGLTKRIHPDHAADPEDAGRRQAAMIRANAAYAAGDRQTLLWLAARFGADEPEEATGVDAQLDRLAARIKQAGGRLAAAEAAYQAAQGTDLARLMRRAEAAEAEGRDLLGKLAAEAQAAVEDRRKRLRALDRRVEKRR